MRLHSTVDAGHRKTLEDQELRKPESKGSSTGEEIYCPMEKIHRIVMLKTVNPAYQPMNFFAEFNIGSFGGENEMFTCDQDYSGEKTERIW